LARILAELAAALRIRDEFIAVASHELKTPLTPLALRLQSLAREVAKQPESQFAHDVSIATEDLSRIFGRFERAVSERDYGGLGLASSPAEPLLKRWMAL
jgi:signal transduction histidine kinase